MAKPIVTMVVAASTTASLFAAENFQVIKVLTGGRATISDLRSI
jgi:hypothetical protein